MFSSSSWNLMPALFRAWHFSLWNIANSISLKYISSGSRGWKREAVIWCHRLELSIYGLSDPRCLMSPDFWPKYLTVSVLWFLFKNGYVLSPNNRMSIFHWSYHYCVLFSTNFLSPQTCRPFISSFILSRWHHFGLQAIKFPVLPTFLHETFVPLFLLWKKDPFSHLELIDPGFHPFLLPQYLTLFIIFSFSFHFASSYQHFNTR